MSRPSIDPERLATSLQGIHRRLDDDEVLPILQRVLSACDELFGLAGCGLLLEDAESGLQFATATNDTSRALELAQVRSSEGPCIDAFIEARPVETQDLSEDPRWPKLSPLAKDLKVRAVLGCPVAIDGISVGSLDVYVDERREWDDSEQAAIARYADVVGSVLAAAIRSQQASEIAEQLRFALESRVKIERAVGYVMAKYGLGAPVAFELLRGSARRERRKVKELAEEVLRGRPLTLHDRSKEP